MMHCDAMKIFTWQKEHDRGDRILEVHKSLPHLQRQEGEQTATTSSSCAASRACPSAAQVTSNKPPLSAWFTILSAFAEPQTPKSAFALFVAARTLFSVTFWNSLPKSHPRRNCLGWAHWASHSNKSRDVGCWPTLRTSLSLQPKILGKHHAAHSPSGLHGMK